MRAFLLGFGIVGVLATLVIFGEKRPNALFRHISNSVVMLTNGIGVGTGFNVAYGNRTFIVTNAHVCGGDQDLLATQEGTPDKLLRVLLSKEDTDLCVLEGYGNDALKISTEDLGMFEHFYILGHPEGRPETLIEGRAEYAAPVRGHLGVVTSALILPGNSGSPVVNDSGALIGVVEAMLTDTREGIFIPIHYLVPLLGEI